MSDWIDWKGGERPVSHDTWVEAHLQNGERRFGPAGWYDWNRHDWRSTNILLYRRFAPVEKPEETPPNAHYRQGEIECIDAIRAALTDEEWRGYCKGNVLKYVWREKHKGGNDTLVKAEDYLRWTIAGKAEGKR